MESIQSYLTPETLRPFASSVLSVVALIAILVAGRYLAGWARSLIRGGLDRPRFDDTLVTFAGNLAYYAIWVLVLLAGLETVGVETVSFVAVLAAAGFAVGIAMQGTLANFAAGIMLLLFRPFSVGDYVETAGETGFVRDIQLFFTKLDTRDNRLVIVPNSDVFGSAIENIFHYEVVRVDCPVGTDYPADLDRTRKVLLRAARSIEDRVGEKGEKAALKGLGDSSIDWEVRIWAAPEDYFRLKQELIRAVKRELDEAGIGIPYPQTDVHLGSMNGHE